MSSLGNLLSGLDKRTLVLPLPVAPMTLLSGLVDGRKSMRSEEAWNVSNGDDQSKQNETPTRWQLPGHPLPCGFYVREGGGEGEKYVLMGAMSSVEKRWASKRGDDCEEKEEQSRGKKKFIAPLLMANLGMCRGSAPRQFLCAAEAPFPVGHFRYVRGEELTEATVEYPAGCNPFLKICTPVQHTFTYMQRPRIARMGEVRPWLIDAHLNWSSAKRTVRVATPQLEYPFPRGCL